MTGLDLSHSESSNLVEAIRLGSAAFDESGISTERIGSAPLSMIGLIGLGGDEAERNRLVELAGGKRDATELARERLRVLIMLSNGLMRNYQMIGKLLGRGYTSNQEPRYWITNVMNTTDPS